MPNKRVPKKGKKNQTFDIKPFKLDIDDLIEEFAKDESTVLADMKRVWVSKKLSFIFEARPTTNLAFFMQSLYAHSIGYMVSSVSLSHRLGGLYCLYCLHETQPFKPPFRIYLSLGELKRLKNLVIDSKKENIKVVSVLVNSMLERNMFLFGSVDLNEGSVTERVNELTDIENAFVQVAQKKLFANSRIEHFIHMDLGMELDVDHLKKMSTDYAVAKGLAIEEAGDVVDVQNIKNITGNHSLIGDVVEKTAEEWNNRKDLFYRQTGYGQNPEELREHGEDENFRQQQGKENIELEEHYGYSHEQGDDGNREEEENDDVLVLELKQPRKQKANSNAISKSAATKKQKTNREDIPSSSQPRDIPSSSRTLQGGVPSNYQVFPSRSVGGVPSNYQVFPSGGVLSNYQVFPSMQNESTLLTPPAVQHVETSSTYIRGQRSGPPREARDRGR